MLEWAGLLVAAYVLGGIPFGYLMVRGIRGMDVRSQGSGSVGATNVARALPKRWRLPGFLAIFLLDAGKGYAATALLPRVFGAGPGGPVAAGLAAVVGHSFTPFLGFRGGKGVATTVGVLAALEPLATGIALAVFLLVYAATRLVSVSSLAMAAALPLAVWLHGEAPRSVLLLTVLLGLLIVVRHRPNIGRLLRGEES